MADSSRDALYRYLVLLSLVQSWVISLRSEARSPPKFGYASPTRPENTTPTMPQRTPLGPISGNQTARKELTPLQRAEITTAAAWVVSRREIEEHYNVPKSTV